MSNCSAAKSEEMWIGHLLLDTTELNVQNMKNLMQNIALIY